MTQICVCGIIIIFLLLCFLCFGRGFYNLFQLKADSCMEMLICGMFVYFFVFQCVVLPIILLQQTLRVCTLLWCVVLCVCLGICIWLSHKQWGTVISNCRVWNRKQWLVRIAVVVVVILIATLTILESVDSWDSAFYLGNMNESLATGTFYVYDGRSGVKNVQLPMQYAMSSFYVHFTVLANIFHVEARVIAVWCMRPLCVILSSCIAYVFGIRLFRGNKQSACILVVLWQVLNLFLTSEFSSSRFVIIRGFEAKGYCAGVVLFALAYALFCVFGDCRDRQNWLKLGVVSWASVPISMSAMMIVPWGIAIAGVTLMIRTRRCKLIFLRALICVLPNICYFVLYYLSTKGLWVIWVR